MQDASACYVEGTEVASKPGLVRWLFSVLTNRKQSKSEKTLEQTMYGQRTLQTKHGSGSVPHPT